MSNQFNIEKKKQTLETNNNFSNINSSTVINHHLNTKTKAQFMADDLLSTNAFLGSNDYFDKEEENNNTQLKTSTKEEEEVILINSIDRNHYYEKLNNFTIKFNPSSDKFIRVPVYENNPTIPQSKEQHKKGIYGDMNNIGWKDSDNKIYPKYDASKPTGNIIGHDSILHKANHTGYVPHNLKNVSSIKVSRMLIPLGLKPLLVENNKSFTNYVKLMMSEVDSYYHSTSSDIEMTTEILVPEKHSLVNSNWYVPISKNTEIKYDPPRNNINNINFNWYPSEWNLNTSIYRGDSGTQEGTYNSIGQNNSNNIVQELWLKDIIKIYGIEFDETFIILKTSFFSSGEGEANNTLWKYGSTIQLNNIIDNIKITTNDTHHSYELSELNDYLTSNNHMIIGTTLVVNGEEKRSLLDIDDDEQQFSQNLIKNRIIILANQNNLIPEDNQLLGDNYTISKDVETIGTEIISLTDTTRTLNVTMKTFFDNSKNEKWKRIWKDGLLFENTQQTWLGRGAYIINISMQNLYTLKIKYQKPFILSDEM
jgi:hypothetical protein